MARGGGEGPAAEGGGYEAAKSASRSAATVVVLDGVLLVKGDGVEAFASEDSALGLGTSKS